MKKRTIWSNRNVNVEFYQESYEEHLELNDLDESKYSLWDFVHDDLQSWLECEEANLNIPTDGRIICIADLGLWDGREQGYQIFGKNVNTIFGQHYDYTEWYSDGYNIRAIDAHHDGVNYYEFREIREDRNIQNLLDTIYSGKKITRRMMNYYTRSLHKRVAAVYGW